MHRGDECEWVQRREEGQRREDWKMKISCKNSHKWFMGSGVKSLFYGISLTQDAVQDMADTDSTMRLQRMHVAAVKWYSGVRVLEKHRFIQRGSVNRITRMPVQLDIFVSTGIILSSAIQDQVKHPGHFPREFHRVAAKTVSQKIPSLDWEML